MAIFIYKILHTGNNFYFDFKEVQTNDEVKKKKKKKKISNNSSGVLHKPIL
jgi:hypothetical protein